MDAKTGILTDKPAPAAAETPVTATAADARFLKVTSASIAHLFESGEYPYDRKMSRRSCEAQETGQKFVILFEGRDAAGKGGTIKRFTEHPNPRSARAVALNKPTWEERGRWFCQRYVRELPTVGEMAFHDRS